MGPTLRAEGAGAQGWISRAAPKHDSTASGRAWTHPGDVRVPSPKLRPLDDCAHAQGIHDAHSRDPPTDDRVVVVQANVVDQVNEDLSVAGVVTSRRDSDRAAPVGLKSHFVARERAVPLALVRAGAPT